MEAFYPNYNVIYLHKNENLKPGSKKLFFLTN